MEEKGYPDALHQLQHQQQPSNNVRETPTIAGRGFPATQSLSYRWGFLPLSFLSPSWDIDPSHPLCNTVCPSLFSPHPMHLHIFLLETTMYSKFPSILREQGRGGTSLGSARSKARARGVFARLDKLQARRLGSASKKINKKSGKNCIFSCIFFIIVRTCLPRFSL